MRFLFGALAAGALCGCVSIDVRDNTVSDRLCSAQIAAATAQEIAEVEGAFVAMVKREGVPAAYAHFAGANAVRFEGGQERLGRAAVIADMANWPQGATLDWTPVTAHGAPCGDMAWTWGRFTMTMADGHAQSGRYITVWTREEDGAWRFDFDEALQ